MTGIFFVSLVVMTLSCNIGWLIPTLVGAGLSLWGQKKQGEAQSRALEASQQATQAQQSFEQQRAAKLDQQQKERLDLLNAMLYGGNVGGQDYAQGLAAQPMAQSWLLDYYKYLRNAPDTMYNAQVGELEGGLNRAYKGAAERMNRRGMLSSGGYGNLLAQIGMEGARGRSRLGGERIQRQGEMIAKGTQMSQGILDKILNLQNTAYGMPQVTSTQVPGMMANTARYQMGLAQQPDVLGQAGGELASAGLLNYLYGNQNRGIGPNDMAIDMEKIPGSEKKAFWAPKSPAYTRRY